MTDTAATIELAALSLTAYGMTAHGLTRADALGVARRTIADLTDYVSLTADHVLLHYDGLAVGL